MALQPRNQKLDSALSDLAPMMNIGLELAATVGFFGLIGWFIDKYAHTEPFWFVALLIFGVIGGMIKFVVVVMNYSKKQKVLHDAKRSAEKVSDAHNP